MNVFKLKQRDCFLYDSQLCRLGRTLGHLAARNAWCVAQLESPSHTHPHTLKHTHTHTTGSSKTTHSSEQGQTEEWASPRRKNGSNSTADKKKRKKNENWLEASNWCWPCQTVPAWTHLRYLQGSSDNDEENKQEVSVATTGDKWFLPLWGHNL